MLMYGFVSASSPVARSLGKNKANCSREQWSRRAWHVCCSVISDRSRNEANIGRDHLLLCPGPAQCAAAIHATGAYFHSPASVYLRRVNKRQRVMSLEQPRPDAESHGTWWDVIYIQPQPTSNLQPPKSFAKEVVQCTRAPSNCIDVLSSCYEVSWHKALHRNFGVNSFD